MGTLGGGLLGAGIGAGTAEEGNRIRGGLIGAGSGAAMGALIGGAAESSGLADELAVVADEAWKSKNEAIRLGEANTRLKELFDQVVGYAQSQESQVSHLSGLLSRLKGAVQG